MSDSCTSDNRRQTCEDDIRNDDGNKKGVDDNDKSEKDGLREALREVVGVIFSAAKGAMLSTRVDNLIGMLPTLVNADGDMKDTYVTKLKAAVQNLDKWNSENSNAVPNILKDVCIDLSGLQDDLDMMMRLRTVLTMNWNRCKVNVTDIDFDHAAHDKDRVAFWKKDAESLKVRTERMLKLLTFCKDIQVVSDNRVLLNILDNEIPCDGPSHVKKLTLINSNNLFQPGSVYRQRLTKLFPSLEVVESVYIEQTEECKCEQKYIITFPVRPVNEKDSKDDDKGEEKGEEDGVEEKGGDGSEECNCIFCNPANDESEDDSSTDSGSDKAPENGSGHSDHSDQSDDDQPINDPNNPWSVLSNLDE